MALCTVNYHSAALKQYRQMNVLLPEQHDGPFPVYYLLTAGAADHTHWVRITNVEVYVRELPLIVVMPNGGIGTYCDMVSGPAYERHLIEDVIGFVDRFFPTIPTREGRVIGGLSMAGYAALRLSLKYQDLFCSANAHSTGFVTLWSREDRIGNLHPQLQAAVEKYRDEFLRMVGPNPWQGEHCVFRTAEEADRSKLPAISFDCGLDDMNLEDNRIFHEHLDQLGIPHSYNEYPGGHTEQYWDEHVQDALAFHCEVLGI